MFEKFKGIFKSDAPEKSLPTGDIAWASDSVMYRLGDFGKYNPDDLMTRKGPTIYRKMLNDEQVKAVARFKRDAITSRDFYFEFDKYVKLSDTEMQRRLDLIDFIISQLDGSFTDGLNAIMSAMYTGYSITEKVFKTVEFDGKTYWGIKRMPLRPFDTFKFVVDEYDNTDKLIQSVNGSEQKLDVQKFIHHVHNPEYDVHYGQSELREAYRAWFSKDMAIKFWNMWLERSGSGYKWIEPEQGQALSVNSPEYVKLQNVLSNSVNGAGMILPPGMKMQIMFPTKNVAYKEAIDEHNLAIAKALLVPNLLGITPSGQTGSYSQSDTQLEAFFWTLDADAARLEETINEQLFRQLGYVNFVDGICPKFKFKPVSNKKKVEIAKVWKDLVTAGAVEATNTDEAHLREILDLPEKGEEIIKQPSQAPTGDAGGKTDPNATEKDTDKDDDNIDVEDNDMVSQTVIGKGGATISAFNKAQSRVDFAVIATNSDQLIEEFTAKSAIIMDSIVADLVVKGKQGGSVENDVKENIKNVKTARNYKRNLNRMFTSMLREFYNLGNKFAEIEIDKAMGQNFSRKADRERLQFIADDFFNLTALKAAGALSDEAESIVANEILNGTQYGKSWPDIEKSIYRTFATKGLITTEQAKDALGEALGVDVPDARLRTLVRTNGFTAINEARYSYFTDPQLDGFVKAFEYSAILDSRTTQICRHLDDDNRGNHSVEWYQQNSQYKPPNHYNCRSLLVPVTAYDLDDYQEGGQPTIEPQGGFK